MPVKEITIIGLGLIGGSLGQALKLIHPHIKICGLDLREEIIREAISKEAIDWGTVNIKEGVERADLIFIATPVAAIGRVTQEILPFLKEGAIITDVGSTKEKIVLLMNEILPTKVHFIGGHPMAGSEKCGLDGANALLFENAAYILTPTPQTNKEVMDTVKSLIESLGAKVILLSPSEHDQKVAAVSHLPHLLASTLVYTVGDLETLDPGYFTLSAGGFRDTTRIAASQSEMWRDIFLQNRQALLSSLNKFKHFLREFEETILCENHQELLILLEKSRQWREKVPTGLKGILPQIVNLTVMVPDRPGVIGEISNLLGKEQVNISDIEIQRVREGNEGTIRLGFGSEEERNKAARLLKEEGFVVQKSGV